MDAARARTAILSLSRIKSHAHLTTPQAELRSLILSASRDRSVAALAPHIAWRSSRPTPSDDVAEAQRLALSTLRPRVKALLRLAAARLSADETREALAATDDPSTVFGEFTAAPTTPASYLSTCILPPADQTVILFALPGTSVDAHQVASTLSGTKVGIPTGGPHGHTVYPWLVRTRYYTATIYLLVASFNDETKLELIPFAGVCGALCMCYERSWGGRLPQEAASEASWTHLSYEWEDVEAGGTVPEICIALGVGKGEVTSSANPERLEWCLDKGLEYLEANTHPEGSDVKAAEMAARGGGGQGGRSMSDEEAEGLSRLVEALQCRMWPSHAAGMSADAAKAAHEEEVKGYQEGIKAANGMQEEVCVPISDPAPAPAAQPNNAAAAPTAAPAAAAGAATAATGAAMAANGNVNSANASATAVEGEGDDVLTDRLLSEMAGPELEPEEPMSQEEREHERVEQLIEQMTFLRERGIRCHTRRGGRGRRGRRWRWRACLGSWARMGRRIECGAGRRSE